MAENRHIIKVTTKGAEKSKRQLQGVSGGLKSMAKSAALAGAAYFGARGLINAIQSSLKLFAEQQLAEVKLESALGKTSATLKKYASALQQTTRFGDELILQGMAQLAFFIKDEKQLKIATKATLDLASAKGMDLVQAADLVAKSVGSSTNALSRYGIAAEGAVGSEERLLSITDEIANLFGGQAEATTASYQGALDQLSNSFGDMQEKIGQALAPAIRDLAVSFNDLLSIPVSEQITAEKNEFDALIGVLNNVNTSETLRARTLEKINSLYSEYLPELLTEKSTTEDIAKAQKAATQELLNRIAIELNREKIIELMRERKSLEKDEEALVKQHTTAVTKLGFEQDRQTKALEKAAEVRANLGKESKFIVAGQVEEQEVMMLAGVGYNMYGDQVFHAQQNVNKLSDSIKDNKSKQEEITKQMLDTSEAALELGKAFSGVGGGGEDGNGDPVVTGFDEYETAMLDRFNLQIQEEEQRQVQEGFMENFIRLHKEEAKALKLVTAAEQAANLARELKFTSAKKWFNIIAQIARATKVNAEVQQAIAVSQAIMFTKKAVTEAMPNWAEVAQVIALGVAQIATIKSQKFALGADYVTDGPEMIMVGDNPSGEERVQVTPLGGDPNINGPQGQNITLNISGNILSDEWTETELIPKIREGIRLGEQVGV